MSVHVSLNVCVGVDVYVDLNVCVGLNVYIEQLLKH